MQDGYARSATFTLKSNVALYGGFAGNEASRENRDWQANETILSGNIGSPEDALDNTYHVVSALSDTDSTTILDGFYVRYGYSAWTGENYPYFPNVNPDCGGGLYVNAGSPTVRNVIFRSNIGVAGAGMYVASGSPTLTNVTFQANRAVLEQNRNKGDGGGGLYLDSGTGTVLLTDVSFWQRGAA